MDKEKIDFYALNEKDWGNLGAEINKFLPPSYPKKAEEIKIYKRRDGEVGADMLFRSSTTGSYRMVRLYQTGASVNVNGCPIAKNDAARENIEKAWKKFKASKLKAFEDEKIM